MEASEWLALQLRRTRLRVAPFAMRLAKWSWRTWKRSDQRISIWRIRLEIYHGWRLNGLLTFLFLMYR